MMAIAQPDGSARETVGYLSPAVVASRRCFLQIYHSMLEISSLLFVLPTRPNVGKKEKKSGCPATPRQQQNTLTLGLEAKLVDHPLHILVDAWKL